MDVRIVRGPNKPTHKRRAAGRWLRELREKRGLTQRELARMVGAEYYTVVSQLENGWGRVPADRYLAWADALGVELREFALRLMSYYDHNLVLAGVAAAHTDGVREAAQLHLLSPRAGSTPETD